MWNDTGSSPDLFDQRDSKIIFIRGRGKVFSGWGYLSINETDFSRYVFFIRADNICTYFF